MRHDHRSPRRALAAGDLKFHLHGERLRGCSVPDLLARSKAWAGCEGSAGSLADAVKALG